MLGGGCASDLGRVMDEWRHWKVIFSALIKHDVPNFWRKRIWLICSSVNFKSTTRFFDED